MVIPRGRLSHGRLVESAGQSRGCAPPPNPGRRMLLRFGALPTATESVRSARSNREGQCSHCAGGILRLAAWNHSSTSKERTLLMSGGASVMAESSRDCTAVGSAVMRISSAEGPIDCSLEGLASRPLGKRLRGMTSLVAGPGPITDTCIRTRGLRSAPGVFEYGRGCVPLSSGV